MDTRTPADIAGVAVAALNAAIDTLTDVSDDLAAAIAGGRYDPAPATRASARRLLAEYDAAQPLRNDAAPDDPQNPLHWVERFRRLLVRLLAATEPGTEDSSPPATHTYRNEPWADPGDVTGPCTICQRPRAEHHSGTVLHGVGTDAS